MQAITKSILILVIVTGSLQVTQAQFSVFRATGTGCTGSSNIFVFTASDCSSLWWTVYGGGTIVSGQNTQSITVKWNSPTSNAMVSVGYSCNNWDGTIISNTAYSPVFEMSNAVTPSVSITSNFTEVCQGTGSITFTASSVNGGSSPYYNWYIDGNNVSSGTSSQFTYNTSSLSSGAHYAYVVMSSNAPCVTAMTASSPNRNFTVTARATYSVMVSGPGIICSNGSEATFYAVVSGTYSNPTYQWFKNTAPVATGNPFTTTVNQGDDIYCVVSSQGCVISPVQSTNTYEANISGLIEPNVAIQLTKLNYCSGETMSLTASSPYGGTSFSWRLNGSQFSTSSTSTSLLVSDNINTPNAFSPGDVISLVVTGLSGTCLSRTDASYSTESVPIQINSMVTPDVSLSTSASMICPGTSQQLTATSANGGNFPTYTWYVDNAVVSGSQNTYVTSSSLAPGSHSIYVVMGSTAPCPTRLTDTSDPVTITVNRAPQVNAEEGFTLTLPDNSATLHASVTDADGTTPSVLWSKVNGGNSTMSDPAATTLLVNNLQGGNYTFRLTATDNCTSTYDDVAITVLYPPNNYNWIKETTVMVAGKFLETDLDVLQIQNSEVNINWRYFDELGKPMQVINVQASPLGNDVVVPVIYDELGRNKKQYLPVTVAETNGYYKKNSDIIDVGASGSWNYKGIAANFYSDTRPFSEREYEPSPLNSIVKEYGPGNDWKTNDKYVGYRDLINTHTTSASGNAEKIIAWKITGGLPDRPVAGTYIETGGYYKSGQLVISSTRDEQGNEVREYTDRTGKMILKKVQAISPAVDLNSTTHWALTYYIYDEFGNLRFVLQPVLSATLHANNTNKPTQDDLNRLAFQYKYDDRKRMIEKKVPGADAIFMVYDNYDRLVLSQDGNQRKNPNGTDRKQWSFTKYDVLSRPVVTGTYTHSVVATQEVMAGVVTTGNESFDGNASTHGYTNAVFPTSGIQVLAVTYYDDDSFKAMISGTEFNAGEVNYKSDVYPDQYKYSAAGNSFPYLKGLVTGTKINVLDQSKYLWTVNYYDDHYRLVQSVSSNIKNGVDRTTNVYDFTGKTIENQISHRVGTATQIISKHYDYDNNGRLRKLWHKVNDNPAVILSGFDYNEAGQLVAKKLHAMADPALAEEESLYNKDVLEVSQYNNEKYIIARNRVVLKPGFSVPAGKTFTARTEKVWAPDSDQSNNSYVQVVDYHYNIRGWLEGINDADAPGDDLFAMKLNYNTPPSTGGIPLYNGNIKEVQWSAAGSDKQLYAYTYDAMNRLTDAQYYNLVHAGHNNRYNEKVIPPPDMLSGYDLNGNILKLQRWGKMSDGVYSLMDNLTYTYTNGTLSTGNLVDRIDDAVAVNVLEDGFKENGEAINEYTYDYNGNLKLDNNKGITSITYNFLNLPQQVNKGASNYIVYTYDATGRKLKEEVFGANPKTMEYAGEFTYENNALQFIHHEEGRISASASFRDYEYFLKDHLGSNRVTFKGRSVTTDYTATLENNTVEEEVGEFKNYPASGSRSALGIFDHTDAGTVYTHSQLLTGAQNYQIGLAKSFEVKAGDAFDLEVFAKYESNVGNPTNLGTLFTAIAATFALPVTGGAGLESQQAREAINVLFDGNVYIGDEEAYEDPTAPKAYLNYILFDDNFVLQDFGFDQIDATANQNSVHDQLSLHFKVKKNGYLYVYLSNENPVLQNVYFDDLKIVRHTAVEQSSDYYPFGLSFNTYKRENSKGEKFLYNGMKLQEALDLGWYDYAARQYDPAIGRFLSIDPAADMMRRFSPYVYAYNNPTRFTDPDGMMPEDTNDDCKGNPDCEKRKREEEQRKKEEEEKKKEQQKKELDKQLEKLMSEITKMPQDGTNINSLALSKKQSAFTEQKYLEINSNVKAILANGGTVIEVAQYLYQFLPTNTQYTPFYFKVNANLGSAGNIVAIVQGVNNILEENYGQALLTAGEWIIGNSNYGIILMGAKVMYLIGSSRLAEAEAMERNTSRFYGMKALHARQHGLYELERHYWNEAIKFGNNAERARKRREE